MSSFTTNTNKHGGAADTAGLVHIRDEEGVVKGFRYKGNEFVHHTGLHHLETAFFNLLSHQKIALGALVGFIALMLFIDWHTTIITLFAMLTALYFFGSPWLFSSSYERWKTPETLADRLRIMVEHTKLYQELLPHKSFAIMKKHYKAYVSGFDGASELRAQLMAANSADEIASIVEKYIVTLTN
jgi:hypothetical protein